MPACKVKKETMQYVLQLAAASNCSAELKLQCKEEPHPIAKTELGLELRRL
jgi:hypothetical protein